MADNDDVQNTTQQIEDMTQQTLNATTAWDQLVSNVIDGATKAGVKVQDFTKIISTLEDHLKDVVSSASFEGSLDSITNLKDPVDSLIGSFIKLNQVFDQSKAFDQFSDKSAAAINTVTMSVDGLADVMKKFGVPGSDALRKVGDGLIANSNQAEKLENSYIGLSAASGDLSKVFETQGGKLNDLTAVTAAYAQKSIDAAEATGLQVHQAMDFSNAMKAIPGVLDEYVQTNIEGEQKTSALVAAMRLMSGTGRDQGDVIKALSTAYDNLSQSQGAINDTAQKGIEYLSTISSVSSTLKLRFDDVEQAMEDVARQFRDIGNETDATANVFGRYTNALRETGLTSKASMQIIEQMTSNMSKLEVGTKAFLSLRSGGVGGLQGAFQIDQLLRQGKLDQVVQMAERSLKQQFGGRVYTQAEAAQSPEAAAQFFRQRQLLQSGAFGVGKGLSDDQATRLLEALGKGDTLAATKAIKSGQDALTAVQKQGTQIQERNNNVLKEVSRFSERSAVAAEITAGASIKSLFGTTGGANADRIRDLMRTAQSAQVEGVHEIQRRDIERGAAPDDANRQLVMQGRELLGSLKDIGGGITSGVEESVKGAAAASKDTVQNIGRFIDEANITRQPPPIRPPDEDRRKDILNRAVSTPRPIPEVPAIVRAPGASDIRNPGTTARPNEPISIKLEITHPDGMTVKKADNTNPIHKHNAASTTLTIP